MSFGEEAANTRVGRDPLATIQGNFASAASLWLNFGKITGQMKAEQESRSQAVS